MHLWLHTHAPSYGVRFGVVNLDRTPDHSCHFKSDISLPFCSFFGTSSVRALHNVCGSLTVIMETNHGP